MAAEQKSEALAAERAEAESRATATVQARIALEEALARKAQEAAEAARRAAEAKRGRVAEEQNLKLATQARKQAERQHSGARLAWSALAVAAVVVLAGIGAAVTYLSPSGKTPTLEEPLKLRLETRLSQDKF
jgi:hypothetical protein